MPYVARGAAPLTLRFAHFAQEDHPANIAAKQFASRVAERTNGAIRIMIFPNNQLGGPPEQAQQIKLGTIDMGLPTQGQLDKYDRAFARGACCPSSSTVRPLVFRVLDGPAMDWLGPLAEKQGFILLRNWDYGFRNVTNSVRPINAPEDVKGLKLRTPPELQIQASMEALGAVVQAIAFPELYLALRRRSWTAGKSDRRDLLQQVLRGAEASRDHPAHLQQHDSHGRSEHLDEADARRSRRSSARRAQRPAT